MNTLIKNKKQMYAALKRGDFGNTVNHWDSLEQMISDPYSGDVGCRCLEINEPWRLYCLPKCDLLDELGRRGRDGTGLEFYESPPDDFRRIQGEVMKGPGGLYFRYTFNRGPMRTALEAEERHARGLEAEMLLKRYSDPGCYDWIQELLTRYEEHVVEFTSYACPVGILRQTWIIWEVRLY